MRERLGTTGVPATSGSIRRFGPFGQLVIAICFGTIPMLAISFVLAGFEAPALALSFTAYALASALAIWLLRQGFPHPVLGSGNLVTLFRLVIVTGLLSGVFGDGSPWLIVWLATFSLVLDGVDGYLARKQQLVSDFGARLDMEVDTALAVVLALIIWSSGITGAWVFLLVIPRYLFVLAARVWPWLRRQLPYSLSRRVVSVLQITALLIVAAPIFGGFLVLPVAITAAALLLWSFGKDVLWLFRARSL